MNSIAPAFISFALETDAMYLELEEALDAGERNLEWYLHLQTKEEIPPPSDSGWEDFTIESPLRYSIQSIVDDYKKLKAEMPEAIKSVLFKGQDFHFPLSLSQEDFLYWWASMDRIYCLGIRWMNREPALFLLESQGTKDVRGFMRLKTQDRLTGNLRNWSNLPEARRSKLSSWLIQLCQNNGKTISTCTKELEQDALLNRVPFFLLEYLQGGIDNYESFFRIDPEKQSVLSVDPSSKTISVPFEDPGSDVLRSFLRTNIESSWKWKNWKVMIDFVSPDSNAQAPRLKLIEGIEPHVHKGTIYLNSLISLDDPQMTQTLNHEFGHILGFPDCYVQFFDRKAFEIVEYSIDPTDIMCSPNGTPRPQHLDRLISTRPD